MPLVYRQDERVTRWIADQLGLADSAPVCSSIGYEIDGELVAGVTFDNMTETNVFVHIASTAHALPREFLLAIGRYVYLQLGALRMTFMVHDNNDRCVALVKGLGAKCEGRLHQGHADGDTLIFVLWRSARFEELLKAHGHPLEPVEYA